MRNSGGGSMLSFEIILKTSKVILLQDPLYSGAKKKYSEKFTIDLKAGVSMPYGKAATEGKELRTISYTLQEMLQKNL